MQRLRRATAGVLVLLLVSAFAQARTLDQVPAYLKKEGGFVSAPAIVVSAVGMTVGAVLALPAALVAAPIGWAAGDPLGYALLPVSVLATGGGEAGYHIGGAVPWALKNSFYDAPMAGIARIKGEAPSGMVADLEPPPPDPTAIQYLASTPADARVPVSDARRVSAALPPPREATSLMLLKRKISPFKPPPDMAAQQARTPRIAPMPPAAPVSAPAQAVPVAPVTTASSAPLPVPERAVRQPAEPAAWRPEPAATGEAAASIEDAAGEIERPSLKGKKKRTKFSERFKF